MVWRYNTYGKPLSLPVVVMVGKVQVARYSIPKKEIHNCTYLPYPWLQLPALERDKAHGAWMRQGTWSKGWVPSTVT